jgi:SAM-dependent methyltransferase
MDSPFRPEHFRRLDESDDALFYEPTRLVTHIDDAAIAALTRFYRRALPEGGAVLDLMSSWVSHLPDDRSYAEVVGQGMNRAELDANPRLTERLVQDLNRDPALPFADNRFDACLIAVSVQYLTRPIELFTEIARVLKPRGIAVASYSNRLFPTKAIALWRALGDADHAKLVGLYMTLAGRFGPMAVEDIAPAPGQSDPLWVVYGWKRAAG